MAQNDFLEPVVSPFAETVSDIEYYQKLKRSLFNGLSNLVICQFVVTPSFNPEEVLQIERSVSGDSYLLCYRKAKSNIWYAKDKKVEIVSYKKTISDSSVLLFNKLFAKAVFKARYYADSSIILDGTNFYFSTWYMGQKSAMTYNIENKVLVQNLISVCYEVVALSKDESTTHIEFNEILKSKIESLIKQFE